MTQPGGASTHLIRGDHQITDRAAADEANPLLIRFMKGGYMSQQDVMLLGGGWILLSILVGVLFCLAIEHVCGRG